VSIEFRQYRHPDDFGPIGDFLIEHYLPKNIDGNWLQPAWEYMHSHPNLDESELSKIGVWEESGSIVGVVHYESSLGEAFFQTHPGFAGLKPRMLDYAEANLRGKTEDGRPYIRVFVNDFDGIFEEHPKSRGYQTERANARPLSMMEISELPPKADMLEGYTLKSLAEDNDLEKIHRLLWKGFNHEGDPPAESIEWRKKMQSGPNFRKDLTIVVESPSQDFVAFSGTWFEPTNRTAFVEPVATDPDHRRKGLGQAAVLEGLRRCAQLGATVAYVGSDLDFYRAIGFERRYVCNCWFSYLD
jgi:predicted N-acetyltransferase YhbS